MVWRMKRRVREKKWMRGWRRRICSWWEGAKEEDRERSWLASSSPKPERGHQQHHQHQFQHHDCQSWFTWKSNLSRVLAKRIRRLAEESSPVGRTTCIFHEWSLKMVLRWKKWGWWWMVVMVMVVGGGGGDVQLFMTHLDFGRSQHSPEPPGNQNFYQSLQILHFQRFLAPTWLMKRNLKRPDLW